MTCCKVATTAAAVGVVVAQMPAIIFWNWIKLCNRCTVVWKMISALFMYFQIGANATTLQGWMCSWNHKRVKVYCDLAESEKWYVNCTRDNFMQCFLLTDEMHVVEKRCLWQARWKLRKKWRRDECAVIVSIFLVLCDEFRSLELKFHSLVVHFLLFWFLSSSCCTFQSQLRNEIFSLN